MLLLLLCFFGHGIYHLLYQSANGSVFGPYVTYIQADNIETKPFVTQLSIKIIQPSKTTCKWANITEDPWAWLCTAQRYWSVYIFLFKVWAKKKKGKKCSPLCLLYLQDSFYNSFAPWSVNTGKTQSSFFISNISISVFDVDFSFQASVKTCTCYQGLSFCLEALAEDQLQNDIPSFTTERACLYLLDVRLPQLQSKSKTVCQWDMAVQHNILNYSTAARWSLYLRKPRNSSPSLKIHDTRPDTILITPLCPFLSLLLLLWTEVQFKNLAALL